MVQFRGGGLDLEELTREIWGQNPMSFSRSAKIAAALVVVAALVFAGRQGQRYYKKNIAAPRAGEIVYRDDCMRCHGPVGQGVAGKADEPLVGEKSIASLAKYIAREMPESDPGTLSLADATASAEYVHKAFYSAEARARNHPPRIELAHLTVRQYRESIADLLGSLRGMTSTTESGGLAGSYRERPERDPAKPDRDRPEVRFKDQVDPVIDFDFGTKPPEKEASPNVSPSIGAAPSSCRIPASMSFASPRPMACASMSTRRKAVAKRTPSSTSG